MKRNWLNALAVSLLALAGSAAATAQPSPEKADAGEKTVTGDPVNAETKRVYVVNFRGEFGRDVSATPMKRVIADIKRMQPDYVIFRLDFEFTHQGDTKEGYMPDPMAYWQLETARQITTLYTEEIANDQSWTKKPHVVMWVRRALGAPAFLPFAAQDIYYTSDGLHGGIGAIEMVHGSPSKRVREKMIGIVMARAEGLAQMGGHDSRILKAMAQSRYKLSVSYEGGKPVLHEDYTGDELLKEDATEDESLRDTLEDRIRFKGNDWLTLNAERALKLGLSRGTADSVDEIAFDLGIHRNYMLVKGRADRILAQWSEDVTKAEEQFQNLWRDFGEIQVNGATANERNQQRGRQMGVLRRIQNLLKDYKEAINPRAIRGAPDNWETQIEIMMEQIKQQIRVDR